MYKHSRTMGVISEDWPVEIEILSNKKYLRILSIFKKHEYACFDLYNSKTTYS